MIRVAVDDLASQQADAVVRPATALLEPATDDFDALERTRQSGGWKRLSHQQPLDVGAAVVTAAGELPADFMIHAVISSATKPVSEDGVRRAVVSVLQRANDWQLATVAIPVLGAGSDTLGVQDAARVLVDTLVSARAPDYPRDVYIVVDSEENRAIVDAFLRRGFAHES